MPITEATMENALHELTVSDEPAADLKSNMDRMEYKAKVQKSTVFLHLKGDPRYPSIADREAAASVDPLVQQAYGEYHDAIRAYNAVANRRTTRQILIDCWRSVNSNRRMGSAM